MCRPHPAAWLSFWRSAKSASLAYPTTGDAELMRPPRNFAKNRIADAQFPPPLLLGEVDAPGITADDWTSNQQMSAFF
jgi:hypothetical protein